MKYKIAMEHLTIKIEYDALRYDELPYDVRLLVDKAKEATDNSYSPYSHFRVGAALRLEDGTIVKGANQENAAFPVTMCAERSAIFNAQSNRPDLAITQIAIAARNSGGFVKDPVTPCGVCRQALLEMEQRYNRRISIYLYGEKAVYAVKGAEALLPLSFADGSMR